ncbi:Gfo/Idh/MocA family protein [Lacipirellula parvula]|uniref:Myo-inositol 2-dehydrogenase n=1 Tax=Lacipirellula parvula TaxID=2650471 RepID=A0A5K7XGX1_9BACT|nr:Gfo/Idh/MocA family oxidoreductase [Lacipirellula parvula]BBO32209.1 myo-inositol 2-dehydrogenase [Lacipirellula parvula]
MDRRRFLQSTAFAASLAAIQPRAFAAAGDKPLRVATIGCGWYGKTDLFHLMQVAPVEVVGLCDVDATMAEGAAELVAQRQPSKKKPPIYGDFRKLLAAEKPDIVNIGTPDHWHALPMIAAVEAGADVYCQKPISVDVAEGAAMVAAAKRTGRTVQVGLQRRSTPHLIEARDRYIRSGKLGKVAFVDIHSYYGGPGGFPPQEKPPANLDWEMYVGPAPWLDYHPRIHPRSWRDFRNFSNGQIGDLCVHMFDVVRYFLDIGWPMTISASGGVFQRDKKSIATIADTQTATFEYPELQVVWTQRNWGESGDKEYPWGATLYGDKGTLKLSVHSYDFKPHGDGAAEHGDHLDERDKYPEDAQHKETEMFAAAATRRHMQDFLAARQEQRLPVSNIEQGHISSASCILANMSMDLGRSFKWDAAAGKIVGDDEANARLARPYRKPWTHPGA